MASLVSNEALTSTVDSGAEHPVFPHDKHRQCQPRITVGFGRNAVGIPGRRVAKDIDRGIFAAWACRIPMRRRIAPFLNLRADQKSPSRM
jgi:hypothetical protein